MMRTVDLTPAQVAELEKLASATGRAQEDLLQEAVENLLAYNDWFREQVQKGLDQAERGELLDDSEVRRRIARMFPS